VRFRPLAAALALVAVPAPLMGERITPAADAQPKPPAGRQFVLSPEGNHLWAYDALTGAAQLVVQAQNGGEPEISTGTAIDPVEQPPPGSPRRDINGQICVDPAGRHVVTGEDTVIPGSGTGSSHDPRIAGWGWFTISGAVIGEIRVEQTGKLAPEAGRGPGYAGDPDNFGCGFLDARRLFTTAIGNTLPGEPANGQLFLWFGPFERGYAQAATDDGTGFFVGEVDHCEIDRTLATAGGIAVDPANGDVYVASNRPDDQGNGSGVWRYRGRWPRTWAECTPEFLAANITKTRVVPPVPGPAVDPFAPTPSSVVISPAGTLVVSSVFSGTVSEFTKAGVWQRDIWPVSPLSPRRGPTGDTPFGLAFTADGTLWIADIGIVLNQPAAEEGSLVRTPFSSPTPFGTTAATGLTFPDGLGVYTARARPGNGDDDEDDKDGEDDDEDGLVTLRPPLPATT
jgi:hypothetical protein